MRDIDVFLDPMCPWCWVLSRWVRTVRDRGGLRVRWRFASQQLIDEAAGTRQPPHIAAIHGRGQELLDVLAAVRRHEGNDAVGSAFEMVGRAVWEQEPAVDVDRLRGQTTAPLDLVAVLTGAGVDPTIADEVTGADRDTVRQETALAIARGGPGLGTPVITFDPPHGPSFFGPVVARVPDDPVAAIDLWRALEHLAMHDGFAELRTTHRSTPDVPLMHALTRVGPPARM